MNVVPQLGRPLLLRAIAVAAQYAVREHAVQLIVAVCRSDEGLLDVGKCVHDDLVELRLAPPPKLLLQFLRERGPQVLPRRLGHVPFRCELERGEDVLDLDAVHVPGLLRLCR